MMAKIHLKTTLRLKHYKTTGKISRMKITAMKMIFLQKMKKMKKKRKILFRCLHLKVNLTLILFALYAFNCLNSHSWYRVGTFIALLVYRDGCKHRKVNADVLTAAAKSQATICKMISILLSE